MRRVTFFWMTFLLAGGPVFAANTVPTFVLPMTCAELLPETGPFVSFFESVANGLVGSDKAMATRMFQVIALKDKLNQENSQSREQNPIDRLIRRTLCYYREQKEPLKPVTYDDSALVSFVRASLKELETRAEEGVYQAELERAQRREYEIQLEKNRSVVDRLRNEADKIASRSYDRLSRSAKKRVENQ